MHSGRICCVQSPDEVGSKYKDVLIDSGSAVFHQLQQLHKTIRIYIQLYGAAETGDLCQRNVSIDE